MPYWHADLLVHDDRVEGFLHGGGGGEYIAGSKHLSRHARRGHPICRAM